MLQHLLLDPEIVLEVLVMAGCKLGKPSLGRRLVWNPDVEGTAALVATGEPMPGQVIAAHLRNLRIPEQTFLDSFDRLKPRGRS